MDILEAGAAQRVEHALRLDELRKSLDSEIEERLRWLDQQRPAVTDR